MKVTITIEVGPSGFGRYGEGVHRNATVDAEAVAIQSINWESFCAGLVEATVVEYLEMPDTDDEEEV